MCRTEPIKSTNWLQLSSKPVPQQITGPLVPDQVPGHVAHRQESLLASRTSQHTSDDSLSMILLSLTLVTVIRQKNRHIKVLYVIHHCCEQIPDLNTGRMCPTGITYTMMFFII